MLVGGERDQQRAGHWRETERSGEPASIVLKSHSAHLKNEISCVKMKNAKIPVWLVLRNPFEFQEIVLILSQRVVCFCPQLFILCLESLQVWKSLCRLCRHTENSTLENVEILLEDQKHGFA